MVAGPAPTAGRKAAPKRKRGRPSIYGDDLAERICLRIEEGETIKDICAKPGMPNWETVRSWLKTKPEFQERYALARELSAYSVELQIIATAQTAVDKDSAAAAKVKIDALKWLAEKRAPKVYGRQLKLEHSGAVTLRHVPDDKLDERIQKLIAKLQGAPKAND